MAWIFLFAFCQVIIILKISLIINRSMFWGVSGVFRAFHMSNFFSWLLLCDECFSVRSHFEREKNMILAWTCDIGIILVWTYFNGMILLWTVWIESGNVDDDGGSTVSKWAHWHMTVIRAEDRKYKNTKSQHKASTTNARIQKYKNQYKGADFPKLQNFCRAQEADAQNTKSK